MNPPLIPSPKVTVNSTKVTVYTLNGQDILDLLIHAGIIPLSDAARLIQIQFDVPGGGDYSNTTIDIDNENPVAVRVTERETS